MRPPLPQSALFEQRSHTKTHSGGSKDSVLLAHDANGVVLHGTEKREARVLRPSLAKAEKEVLVVLAAVPVPALADAALADAALAAESLVTAAAARA